MSVVVHEPEQLAYQLGPPPPIIPYSIRVHEPEQLAYQLGPPPPIIPYSIRVHEPEQLAYQLGPPPPIIPYSIRVHEPEQLAWHQRLDGGNHRIAGVVRAEAEPDGSATVLLFDAALSGPLRMVKTNPDGSYAFEHIRPGTYHVVAIDDSNPPYHPDIVRVDSEPM